MNCPYVIDPVREIVYLSADGDVHPSELIHALRAIKRNTTYRPTFSILADLRTMDAPFAEADLRILAYYFGSLSDLLQGRFTLVTKAEDLPLYLRWIALILPLGIKAHHFTNLSAAELWIEGIQIY